MKLKLTLRRSGADAVDLLATVDAAATVGDLATALAVRDPGPGARPSGPVTLELLGTDRIRLDATQLLADSDLLSGCSVALASDGVADRGPVRQPAAVVRVLEGPDAGRQYSVGRGTNHVGRSVDCEIQLSDTSVSREHARLIIGSVAEIVDLGSSNGVAVDGGLVSRAVLRPRDQVRLADTVFSVEVLESVTTAGPGTGTSSPFNRSPRVDPVFAGVEVPLPDPPERQQNQRLPVIALIAPLLFGALLFAITRSPTSLVFVALSPIMAVGNVLESRMAGKRSYAAALVTWRRELDGLAVAARDQVVRERAARLSEHPSAEDVRQAVMHRSPLLWQRRPEQDRFLEVRLGVGTMVSRSSFTLPTARRCEASVWQQLVELQAEFRDVPEVPVVARLREGPLGVAAPRPVALGVTRAILQQLAGAHSPAEVVLAAVLASDGTADWEWLSWLPHTSSAHSPLTARHLAANPAGVTTLLAELEELVDARTADPDSAGLPAVVLLVEDAAATDRARLVSLSERGTAAGVHVLWTSAAVRQLPAGCAAYVAVAPGQSLGVAGFPLSATGVAPLVVEMADLPAMTAMSRAMAPLVDSGAPLEDDSDLPRSVPWLGLHDRQMADQTSAVLERWQESRSVMTGPFASPPRRGKPGSLRAVIGQTAGESYTLDLRTHGPHALVGGTTGSGKSELLQSWILGMAAAHSPERVTFLLVDYKGGSAFRECLDLPHTVGLVTDLSPHLVRRALTSLAAELKHREELLAHKKKKDLSELELTGDPDAPPSLVIVVDEFAALVHEVPAFVDGVVNVAQRGRSLGLHLILATQRPAGVIKGNLRANTNLRIALRVADADDSTDVVGSPVAGSFDPSIPGRALAKTGPGRLVPFQSAYAGGWTTDSPPPPGIDLEELAVGVRAAWDEPEEAEPTAPANPGPTDIARVVETIRSAATQATLPQPRKPWLPELPDVQELATLPTARRDDQLVFGQVDVPQDQAQPTIAFHPDRDGNLAVYGTGGSGKSGLLRSLAIASGFTYRGGPCQVYGLDFGARGLDMLQKLPHVGSIIPGADHERVSRLLADLRRTIDERAVRFAAVNSGTITEYRSLAGRPDEARILLLVDGIGAFRTSYEGSDKVRWFEMFQSIASEGRPVGVHIVLSADRPAAVPSSLASAVQSRVVLRLADDGDYSTLGEPDDVLGGASPPGRGLVDGAEVQVAILGGTRNTLQQAQAIGRLAATMRRAGVPEASPVESLAREVSLDALPPLVDGLPVVGVAGSHLGPLGFVPSGPFVITGPPGSGRSTALRTVLDAVLRTRPETQVHYVGARRSPLAALPFLNSCVTNPVDAAALAGRLTADLVAGTRVPVMLVLEGVADYLNGPADLPLQQLVKALLADDHLVVAEGETSTMSSSMGLLGLVKAARNGLALQPESAEASVFRTDFPRLRRVDLPAGRAVLVSAGRPLLMQVALPGLLRLPGQGSPPPSLAVL